MPATSKRAPSAVTGGSAGKGSQAAVAVSAKSRGATSTAATRRNGLATDRVLRETFNQLSKGKSGRLPLNLIGLALRMNNQCPTEAQLNKIIQNNTHADAVDSEPVRQITFDEFCGIMRENWKTRDQLMEEISAACETFDNGETGVLRADDLKMQLTSLGEVLDEAEVVEMIKDANSVEGKVPLANLAKLLLDAYSRPTSKKSGNKKDGAASGRSLGSRKSSHK